MKKSAHDVFSSVFFCWRTAGIAANSLLSENFGFRLLLSVAWTWTSSAFIAFPPFRDRALQAMCRSQNRGMSGKKPRP
jgi:hypothetical protein